MPNGYKGPPPPEGEKRPWIHRIKSSDDQQFVVLSEEVWSFDTHYHAGRSCECTRSTGSCEGCESRSKPRWAGFIHCLEFDGRTECYVELTGPAAKALRLNAGPEESLRGLQVQLRRSKGGAKGKYIVKVLERRINPATLPADRSPVELLRWLWKIRRNTVQTA